MPATAEPTQATGSPDPVSAFLRHLAAHDYAIGPRDFINADALWIALAARRELPADLRERLALLRPLVCRTPRQQQDFPELLARWRPPRRSAAPRGWSRHAAATEPRARSTRVVPALLIALLVAVLLTGLWWTRPNLHIPAPRQLPVVESPRTPTAAPPSTNRTPDDSSGALPLAQPVASGVAQELAAWLDAAGWAGGLLLAAMGATYALRRAALQPLSTHARLEQRTLFGDQADLLPPQVPLLRVVSRELRRPRHTERQALDIPRTIAATVHDGGVFAARHRAVRGTPEYLVLIGERGAHDQLARIAEEIVGVLLRQGVALDVLLYHRDPSNCEVARLERDGRIRADRSRSRARLADLLSRVGGSRLLLFGDAQDLFDPVTGGLRDGVGGFTSLEASVVFTPLPVPSWGSNEQWLAQRGVLVLPLQLLALASAADWLVSQRVLLSLDPDWPAVYPRRLRGDALRWVAGDAAPAAAEIDHLLFELEVFLGANRMQWLCACAAFPVPSWPITLALRPLFIPPGADRVAGAVALAALPWFREGRWPQWLRAALQARLDPRHREAVGAEIERRLDMARLGLEVPSGAERLAEVTTEPRLRDRLQRAWRRFAARQWIARGEGRLRRDVLFLGFIQRGLPRLLMVVVPERLRRLLFREGLPIMGVRIWVPAVALAMAVGGLSMHWRPAREWAEARLGGPVLPGLPLVARIDAGAAVKDVAFARMGRAIVTADESGRVVVWSRDARRLAQLDTPRKLPIEKLSVDPSGERVLAIDAEGATLWHGDGRVMHIPVKVGPVEAAFSRSGDAFAAALGGSVLISNGLRSWRVQVLDGAEVVRLAFGSDDRNILVATSDGRVRILRLDGSAGAVTEPPFGNPEDVAMTRDGQWIAYVGRGNPTVLQRFDSGRPVGERIELDGYPNAAPQGRVEFSQAGDLLRGMTREGVLHIWRVDGSTSGVLDAAPRGRAWAADFSADGKFIFVGAPPKRAGMLWTTTGTPIARLGASDVRGRFAPSGRQLVTFGAGSTLALWGERLPAEGVHWGAPVPAVPPMVLPPTSAAPPVQAASPVGAPPAQAASPVRVPSPSIVVPDLVGQSAASAARAAPRLKLRLYNEEDPDFCVDTIVTQAPAPGTSMPIDQALALGVTRNKTEFWPLLCRGGYVEMKTTKAARPGLRRLEFAIDPGTGPAQEGLHPGQCTWRDRAFRPGEPTRLQIDVKVAASLDLAMRSRDQSRYFELQAVNRGAYLRAGCFKEAEPPPIPLAKVAADVASAPQGQNLNAGATGVTPPTMLQSEVKQERQPLSSASASAPSMAAQPDASAEGVLRFFGDSRNPRVNQTNVEGARFLQRELARRGLVHPDWLAIAMAIIKRDMRGMTPREEQPSEANTIKEPFDMYEPGGIFGLALGNIERGDGARFRARSYLQIAGRSAYVRYSAALGSDDLVAEPQLLNEVGLSCQVIAHWLATDVAQKVKAPFAADAVDAVHRLYTVRNTNMMWVDNPNQRGSSPVRRRIEIQEESQLRALHAAFLEAQTVSTALVAEAAREAKTK